MKNNNVKYNNVENALTMYKENVSPSETYFQAILSQIPEQQKLKEGRAVRSPYRWLAVTQIIAMAVVLIAIIPAYNKNQSISSNPYYETDKQVEEFEKQIDNEDYEYGINLSLY